jgi:hypothetical protein
MATQTGVLRFRGGLGDIRGYKRGGDIKCNSFLSKNGGCKKKTFNDSLRMDVNRRFANEFQGCVSAALEAHNFYRNIYHLKGFDFKQRYFKQIFGFMQTCSGVFGQRHLELKNLALNTLPFRIGKYSFEKFCSLKFSVTWDTPTYNATFTSIGDLTADMIKHNPTATHFDFCFSVFCASNWFSEPDMKNKYIMQSPENTSKRNSVLYGYHTISSLPFPITCYVPLFFLNHPSTDIYYASVEIRTGKEINSVFNPDYKYFGSSIIQLH